MPRPSERAEAGWALAQLSAAERHRRQNAPALLLVRPAGPSINPETRASNAFQVAARPPPDAAARARAEFDGLLAALTQADVETLVLEEPSLDPLPDSVFPNNWFSTHQSGELLLYPMLSPLRRRERRPAFIAAIAARVGARELLDWSAEEAAGRFLEGTGSLVFDQLGRQVFAALSPRTDRGLVERFGARLGFTPVCFNTRHGPAGEAIYHTNVVLSIGADLALCCLDAIVEPAPVVAALEAAGRRVLALRLDQLEQFCANALEVRSRAGAARWVLSARAAAALDPEQRRALEAQGPLISAPLETIETLGGGSARCMLAELWPTAFGTQAIPAGS